MRLLLALALLVSGSAWADSEAKIIGGMPDGDAHGYACALATRGSVGQYYAHCGATLIDSRHALTAKHCSWTGADQIGDWRTTISCRPEIDPREEWKYLHHGNLYVMADRDFALIELDEPIEDEGLIQRFRERTGREPFAKLPTLNQLAEHPSTFYIVGYGNDAKGEDQNFGAHTRRVGTAEYKSRGDVKFMLSSAPSEICGGDSGSGAYAGATNLLMGVASETVGNCSGDMIYVRTDTADVIAFLAGHGVRQ